MKESVNLDYSHNHLRNKNGIGIASILGGTIVGDCEIILAGSNETIQIKHIAQSREIFALGAIKAGEFIIDKPAGLYSMQDIFDKTNS